MRLLLSSAILTLGLVWVAAGAPLLGSSSGLLDASDQRHFSCDPREPTCAEEINNYFNSQRPSPAPEVENARARSIVLEDKDVVSLLGSATTLGSDVWAHVDHISQRRGAQRLAWVDLVMDQPISFSGDLPAAVDPCSGHFGEGERLDEGDPCLSQPVTKEPSYIKASFVNVRHVQVLVDMTAGEVLMILADPDVPDNEIEDMIGQFESEAAR